MKELTCLIAARLGSERVKNKMLRPFADSCLLEIALRKVLRSKHLSPARIYLSAYDEEIKAIGRKVGVQIYNRSEASTHEPVAPQVIWSYVNEIRGDHFININACNALLSVETIDRAIEFYKKEPIRSLFSVVKRPNFFFDKESHLVNRFNGEEKYKRTIETKMIEPLYEAAHSIYIWDAGFMRKEWAMWSFTKNDPYLFEIPIEESFDIDYPWQFELAEAIYKQRRSSETHALSR